MKKDNKKLIIILVILIFLLIIILLIKNIYKSDNSNINNNSNNLINNNLTNQNSKSNSNTGVGRKLSISIDDSININTYSLINNIINNFLTTIFMENKESAYNMLSNDFIKDNQITKNNIFDKLGLDSGDAGANIEKLYSVSTGTNNYIYAANANIEFYSIEGDFLSSQKKLFIITLYDNYFSISIGEYQDNIQSYLKNKQFNYVKIEKNKDNKYDKVNLNEYQIAKKYAEYYYSVLNKDINKAYNMLSDDSKNKFINTDALYNYLINEENYYYKTIIGTSSKKQDDSKIYYIDYDSFVMEIIEYNAMDIKINIK